MRHSKPEPNPDQAAFVFDELTLPADKTHKIQEAALLPPVIMPEHIPIYTVFLRRSDVIAVRERPTIHSPQDVAAVVSEFLRETDREHFIVLLLDTKNTVGSETQKRRSSSSTPSAFTGAPSCPSRQLRGGLQDVLCSRNLRRFVDRLHTKHF